MVINEALACGVPVYHPAAQGPYDFRICLKGGTADTIETNIDPFIARESQDFFHIICGSVIDTMVCPIRSAAFSCELDKAMTVLFPRRFAI